MTYISLHVSKSCTFESSISSNNRKESVTVSLDQITFDMDRITFDMLCFSRIFLIIGQAELFFIYITTFTIKINAINTKLDAKHLNEIIYLLAKNDELPLFIA